MATIETARDDIIGLFRTAWLADVESQNVPLFYWDIPNPAPSGEDGDGNPVSWARVSVQHLPGQHQATLSGDTGQRRWRRTGIVTVQIFAPYGTGLSIGDKLGMVALRAFEGQSTPSGIWFRDVSFQEVGQDSIWFNSNVSATFEYDEVR